MNKTTKYYKSEKMSSGQVTIPTAIADILGWEHKDEIILQFDKIKGKKGLFLYKSQGEGKD